MVGSIKKYGFIDETRGLAILMVILVHTAQTIHDLPKYLFEIGYYGQMGVQLFFIASAFTMCNSFASRSNEKHSVKSFYLRRFFRVAPLYYVGIALYFLIAIIVDSKEQYTIWHILSNMLFIHGFVPSANNNIVPGGWSIGTEMAFYAVFPVIYYWITAKDSAKWNKLRSILAVFLAIVFNIVFQFMVITFTHLGIENNNFFYFFLLNQLPVFLLGFVYYFIFWKIEHKISAIARLAIQIVGFLAFSVLALRTLFSANTPFAYIFLPVFSGISFVFLIDFLRTKNLSLRVLQNIGRVSYSMYIFHFIFAVYLVPRLLSLINVEIDPSFELLCSFLLTVSFSFVFARISEKVIEENGIAFGAKIIDKFIQ